MRHGPCSQLERSQTQNKSKNLWALSCEVVKLKDSHFIAELSVWCFIFLTVSWTEEKPLYQHIMFRLLWVKFSCCEKQNETGRRVLLQLSISEKKKKKYSLLCTFHNEQSPEIADDSIFSTCGISGFRAKKLVGTLESVVLLFMCW